MQRLLYLNCLPGVLSQAVSVLWLFLTVPWVGLQCDCGISCCKLYSLFSIKALMQFNVEKVYADFNKNINTIYLAKMNAEFNNRITAL